VTKAGDDTPDKFHTQQLEYLGKPADALMVFPYGLHANVTPDALALIFSAQANPENRAAIAWTPKQRPKLAEGEAAFYHPPTGAFIIWKANGDLDIEVGEGGEGTVNVTCKDANVTASNDVNVTAATSVNIDSPVTNLGVGGEPIARVGDEVEVEVTSGSSAGTYTGTITSGGDNTSI